MEGVGAAISAWGLEPNKSHHLMYLSILKRTRRGKNNFSKYKNLVNMNEYNFLWEVTAAIYEWRNLVDSVPYYLAPPSVFILIETF